MKCPQADVIGQALGCVDPCEKESTPDAREVTANGASREGEGGAQECLALGNTENNESIQGLVRSAGCLWLGVFGLPPVPSGEDEEVRRGGGNSDFDSSDECGDAPHVVDGKSSVRCCR